MKVLFVYSNQHQQSRAVLLLLFFVCFVLIIIIIIIIFLQVSKWMLSKGQGKTMGTFTLLLEALDHEGRVEEADALFEKLLTEHEDATPRYMFTVVIAMFERHNNPRRLLQVN